MESPENVPKIESDLLHPNPFYGFCKRLVAGSGVDFPKLLLLAPAKILFSLEIWLYLWLDQGRFGS